MLSHLQKSKIFVKKTTTKQIDSGSNMIKITMFFIWYVFVPHQQRILKVAYIKNKNNLHLNTLNVWDKLNALLFLNMTHYILITAVIHL